MCVYSKIYATILFFIDYWIINIDYSLFTIESEHDGY